MSGSIRPEVSGWSQQALIAIQVESYSMNNRRRPTLRVGVETEVDVRVSIAKHTPLPLYRYGRQAGRHTADSVQRDPRLSSRQQQKSLNRDIHPGHPWQEADVNQAFDSQSKLVREPSQTSVRQTSYI